MPNSNKSIPAQTNLSITGMTCGACAVRLEKALNRVSGVEAAAVNFATEKAEVAFDSNTLDVQQIAEAVGKAGFAVKPTTHKLDVDGMTCTACAMRLEKALKKVPGVADATVNFAIERAS